MYWRIESILYTEPGIFNHACDACGAWLSKDRLTIEINIEELHKYRGRMVPSNLSTLHLCDKHDNNLEQAVHEAYIKYPIYHGDDERKEFNNRMDVLTDNNIPYSDAERRTWERIRLIRKMDIDAGELEQGTPEGELVKINTEMNTKMKLG
jgi:hypothetical protein